MSNDHSFSLGQELEEELVSWSSGPPGLELMCGVDFIANKAATNPPLSDQTIIAELVSYRQVIQPGTGIWDLLIPGPYRFTEYRDVSVTGESGKEQTVNS
ncbi:uncharacterized protein I206_107128 [Kwoniella pini CBS 10737]|uniref:Uncharacterized protein n=1 Tax=Kwoniella pini CBS 10737 TaxID=1296096 RepID=A0A1B9HZ38_9TREE|nr:uncharacterized protein I206_05328 [Kwoniella pini CBS 10737]OCF48549.1 hypothetical protein I206_05328 [Kwoniella pini CBS 10737]